MSEVLDADTDAAASKIEFLEAVADLERGLPPWIRAYPIRFAELHRLNQWSRVEQVSNRSCKI